MPRFLHLADLHIGKRLGEYSLLEDQQDVLAQALRTVRGQHCDAVLIAGDVYDKPSPAVEAMAVFDAFLTELAGMDIPVIVISGNHDAAGRISYFSELLARNRITVSRPFDGKLQSAGEIGGVQLWMLPFITPARVRPFYPEEKLETYEDAVRLVLGSVSLDPTKVNVILAHQFITGGSISDSEEFAVGGLDNVGAEVFDGFDYAALGHLHQPQYCGRETVRYAGSPLKYSVSEEHRPKTFTIVDIQGKEDIHIEEVPILLPHDVRTVKGTFEELSALPVTEDFVRIILTDEQPDPDARILLRSNFPHMLRFGIENSRTRTDRNVTAEEPVEQFTPLELFAKFFAHQNNDQPPSEKQMDIAREIFARLQEEEKP